MSDETMARVFGPSSPRRSWAKERESTMASILLVEDDDQLRSTLKELLTRSGYEVSEASDGRRVCDMHQRQRFDLVITDLVMPDIEGLALIMELRRIDQNLRIIAMSGAREGRAKEYLRIAQKLGAQLTLAKPFGNQEFLEAVSLALENSSAK
jgi:two-component system, chemotaxis family, chemotaxis protein CheY